MIGEREVWRVGEHYGIHVYAGDRPVATFHRSQDATQAVGDRGAAEARDRHVRAEALRAFADTRGIKVGDEDDEWWRGYRQAQRECLHDAVRYAEREEADQ